MNRWTCLGATLLVTLAGLCLRLGPWRLPLSVHHIGGGLLWGMMLYGLAATVRPPGSERIACLVIAGVAAIGIECVRLLDWPVLDAFRRSLAGQLLLGRIFSGWNLLTYATGILAMAALLRPVVRSRSREEPEAGPLA